MAKWICFDCGDQFDEPKEYQENVGDFWGCPAYETFIICPHCDSECIEKAGGDDE